MLWPIVVLVAVVVLRPSIKDLVAVPLKRLRLGPAGFEAEWHERERKVTAAIVQAEARSSGSELLPAGTVESGAEVSSPHEAVHDAYRQVVDELKVVAERGNVEEVSDPVTLATRLVSRGLIDAYIPDTVSGLRDLVALATYDPGRLTLDEAQKFVVYAQITVNSIRRAASRRRAD